jgi:asparagine synthase (glutamine-hydrolysing)
MCGIAGMIDLKESRLPPPGVLARMAAALTHRGPDEDGFLEQPGVGLASRRLSIVGLADGRQPLANEDRSVFAVFNGEAFDYPQLRAQLRARGHRFVTRCDTEVVPHLWEEYGAEFLNHLRGQFALAVWDRRRRALLLARDRLGICPLFWTRQMVDGTEWLLFAGLVSAGIDVRGIDQLFNFYALPGPRTCFAGVQSLLPGHALLIEQNPGEPARLSERTWWEVDFPDRGDEGPIPRAVDQFEELLLRAVERRLRADVPVAAYLSGGVDSTLVAAMARRLHHGPLKTFTLQIHAPGLDESSRAAEAAQSIDCESVVIPCGDQDVLAAYPELIRAAEAPVNDTCCAALLLLAREVHRHGFKVVLTGEGADESLAGYPWYKIHRLLGMLEGGTGLPLGRWARRLFFRWVGGTDFSWNQVRRAARVIGGHPAWLDLYTLVSLSKHLFYGPRLLDELRGYVPWEDLGLNQKRFRRWHPLNQSLYPGLRIHLPGLLLSLAGDRVAMHSSVETRYPFLDEDLFDFLARLPPDWKLHRLQDKFLERRVAQRWLPRSIAWRGKTMFRTPFDVFATAPAPAWVEQLLSPESLRATDYFDVDKVAKWRRKLPKMWAGGARHFAVSIGLAGVAATQLWHHTFIAALADLPTFQPAEARPRAGVRAAG